MTESLSPFVAPSLCRSVDLFLSEFASYQAIQCVGEHVEYESEADDVVGFFEKEKRYIDNHSVIGVQGMKIDAAAIGVKNGVGEQMVQIYEHRGE